MSTLDLLRNNCPSTPELSRASTPNRRHRALKKGRAQSAYLIRVQEYLSKDQVFPGVEGYSISNFNSTVDHKLSTLLSKSNLAKDEKQHFLNTALKLKAHVPAPNTYKIPQLVQVMEKRIPYKNLYKSDRKTLFTELQHHVKHEGITAKPTSYDPNPLHFRKGSAKIKGNLTISDSRVTIPIEATFYGK